MERCEEKEMDDHEACAAECFLKLGTPQFSRMAACAMNSGCIKSTEALSNKKSPKTIPSKLDGQFNLHDLTGHLYFARGISPSYPRMDCMHVIATAHQQKGRLDFKVVYPVPERNLTRSFEYSMQEKAPGSSSFWTKFEVFGMKSDEQIYILDMIEGFYLFVITGKGFGGEYQHAVIYSREPSDHVPSEIEDRFDKVLEDAGLYEYMPRLSDFKGVPYGNPICKAFLPRM